MDRKYKISVIFYKDFDTSQCWSKLCQKSQIINSKFCDDHINKYFTDSCPICLEDFNQLDEALKPCGHWVHIKCIYKSGRGTCPLCRKKLVLTDDEIKCLKSVIYDDAIDPPANEVTEHIGYDSFTIHSFTIL
jgi:hypothetical protein